MATSRKRVKKKRTKISQKIAIQTGVISDKQVKSISELAFLLTFSYIIFSILLKIAFTYKSFANRPELFNKFDLMYLLGVIILPTVLISYSAINGMSRIRNMPVRVAYKRLRSIVIIFSILIVFTIVGILYALGLFVYTAELIYTNAPRIGTTLSNAFSTIFGWIVSGVIGNLVYDILKKRYLNKFKLK